MYDTKQSFLRIIYFIYQLMAFNVSDIGFPLVYGWLTIDVTMNSLNTNALQKRYSIWMTCVTVIATMTYPMS